jgi:hypothetical protein
MLWVTDSSCMAGKSRVQHGDGEKLRQWLVPNLLRQPALEFGETA